MGCIFREILSMRSSILSLTLTLLSASLSAQGVFSNKTQVILEKVIQDYPNHFTNIRAEQIGQALQTASYKSTLQLPGSRSSTITLGTAGGNEESDWTCTVLTTSSFEEAKTRYSEIYGELSNSIISTDNRQTFIISGQYEVPSEERKYTQVVFSLLPGVGVMKRLRVELVMQQQSLNWVVTITVSDKDREMVAASGN
jgi:hypothetical protein